MPDRPDVAIRSLDDRLLVLEEVAELIHTTPKALAQLRHIGKGPKGIRIGKRMLYPESAVLAWLNSRAEITEPAKAAS